MPGGSSRRWAWRRPSRSSSSCCGSAATATGRYAWRAPVPEETLLRTFRFRVKLLRSATAESGSTRGPAPIPSGTPLPGDGAFQECSGLELAMDVQEHLEGGRNDGVIKRVGRAKVQELV